MLLPIEIPTVMENITRYFMTKGMNIPEHQRNIIIPMMGPGTSPVDFIVKVAEVLYATADDLDDEGREVAAQAANIALMYGWHDMSQRGPAIINAMRRLNGEETSEAIEDVEPKKEYVFVTPATANEELPTL